MLSFGIVVIHFSNLDGQDAKFFLYYFGKRIRDRVCFLFPFETSEQCNFFSENFAVNVYPVRVVARFRLNCCYYNC